MRICFYGEPDRYEAEASIARRAPAARECSRAKRKNILNWRPLPIDAENVEAFTFRQLQELFLDWNARENGSD
jgi:hypothetical protein